MDYKIEYTPAKKEMAVSIYTVICQDSEAKSFMRTINKELIRMEANRKIEAKHALKEGVRDQPHRQMKKEKNKFIFDDFQKNDVCNAAQNLRNRQIKCSFIGPTIIITLQDIEKLERSITEISV